MSDENYIKEIINNAVQETLNKMFSEFESKIEVNMTNKMNVMSNSFAYIVKVLEDSGIATSNIDKHKISWQTDMKNIAYELIHINKEEFPTYNSVLKAVYLKLRNVYGIVLDQLRKEYKDRYGLDYFPDALEAVSDDKTSRDLFEMVLRGLFPQDYWSHKDGVIDDEYSEIKTQEEIVRDIIKPLAEKYNDATKGYNKTFRVVYKRMGCSWSNLQTRYKNSNNLKTTPQKLTIVINNQDVFRKFKKCVRELLDETN